MPVTIHGGRVDGNTGVSAGRGTIGGHNGSPQRRHARGAEPTDEESIVFDPTALTRTELAELRARIADRVTELDPVQGCAMTAPVYDYPTIRIRGQLYRLPGVAYALDHGPVPPRHVVDHECHNVAATAGLCLGGTGDRHRACIRGVHLVARTIADNLRRSPLVGSRYPLQLRNG
jgi:hypothetical protein